MPIVDPPNNQILYDMYCELYERMDGFFLEMADLMRAGMRVHLPTFHCPACGKQFIESTTPVTQHVPLPSVPRSDHSRRYAYLAIQSFLTIPCSEVAEWVDQYLSTATDSEWIREPDPFLDDSLGFYKVLSEYAANPDRETIHVFRKYINRINLQVGCCMRPYQYRQLWDRLSANPHPDAVDFFDEYPEHVNWKIVAQHHPDDPRVRARLDK